MNFLSKKLIPILSLGLTLLTLTFISTSEANPD